MLPAAVLSTSQHKCPSFTGIVPHVGQTVQIPSGSKTTLIQNMPAAGVGDQALCTGPPAAVLNGAPTVLIGGKPAARLGDPTAHGGVIVNGITTVLIGGAAASPPAADLGGFTDLAADLPDDMVELLKAEGPDALKKEMRERDMDDELDDFPSG